MHDVNVEAPRWISIYESLAETLANGYDMCIYEYTNDMSCRELLEKHRDHPAVRKYAPLIQLADDKLRATLKPTKRCIHGEFPRSHWWYWMYPPNSPELESDLLEREMI